MCLNCNTNPTSNTSRTGEILIDNSRTGRERPWNQHKINSVLLAHSYKRLELENKANRVSECGSQLKFNECPEGHEKRLSWANFCRVRLCPMCGWRRSLLVAHQTKLIAHHAVQREKIRWLFLTLTVENVPGEELNARISEMMKAWNLLFRRKIFKENILGWMRSLEVTAEKNREGHYHPHFHILLAVRPSYFKGGNYIKQKDWSLMWQKSLKADYMPIVHITAVKDKRNAKREAEILADKGIEMTQEGFNELPASQVAEMAKYTVKSSDYIDKDDKGRTDARVSLLDEVLAGRRLFAFGGLLKEVWNDLKASGEVEDAEDEQADLVHVDSDNQCRCSVCGSDMLEHLYSWIPSANKYIG